MRDEVTGGAQTVAVQHTAGIPSVAEEQGGRTVPWLHQDGVVFVEGLQVFTDGVLVVERFGHQHRHGVWQAQAGHDEEFQYVVQRGRVAHVRLDNGADIFHVAQCRGRKYAFARFHPAAVAADGVYFAVVRQQAEGLCQTPCREGVRAETRVDDGQSAGEVGLCQVAEVCPHLGGRQHTFIYNGTAGQGHDVEILLVYALLYLLADDVECAFQVLRVSGSGDEYLLDVRFRLACTLSQNIRVDGDRTQVHQGEPFPFYFFNDDAQDMFLFLRIFGQENESCTIFTFFRYRDALQQDEFVWNLYHDTCAVARLVIGAFCSAVFHVLQYSQGGVHQFVRLASV